MKMAKFPWVNKGKLYWHDDNYYLTVSPEKNKLHIGDIDILEFHKRWGLAGLTGPFTVITNVRESLTRDIVSAHLLGHADPWRRSRPRSIVDELFEDDQRPEPSLNRPRFLPLETNDSSGKEIIEERAGNPRKKL